MTADPSAIADGRARSRLPRNVIMLGLLSLLTDSASEMVLPLLPAFIIALGGGALALGSIEGAAEAVASVLKLAAGRWTDRTGRRRPFVIAGYSLAAAVRPLYSLAQAPFHVLAVRVSDRVGKGLRSSPRDALLAASIEPERRGAAFGWHRAMDHLGAVVGPLCAALFLLFSHRLRTLFLLTAVPGALAVLVAIIGVREVPPPGVNASLPPVVNAPPPEVHSPTGRAPATPAVDVPRGLLVRVLVPIGLFALGNASDTFLLLQAGGAGASLFELPLLWMGLHGVKSVSSLYGGRLADSWGKRPTIALGWIVYAAIYAGFAFAGGQRQIAALFVIYGVYHGLSEGAEKALVADVVPHSRRGAGFGWYYLSQGMLLLLANLLFGAIWAGISAKAAFLTSAALACVSALLLGALR